MHIKPDGASTPLPANYAGVDKPSTPISAKGGVLQRPDGTQKAIKVTQEPHIKELALNNFPNDDNQKRSLLNREVHIVADPKVSHVGMQHLKPEQQKEIISAEEILKEDAKQTASEILTVTGSENLTESGSEILNKDV